MRIRNVSVVAMTLSTAMCLVACSENATRPPEREEAVQESSKREREHAQLLDKGARLLREGRPADAIRDGFDPVLAAFASDEREPGTAVYCARSPVESLLYLGAAAAADRRAVVLDATWSDAHYMKGYALIEMGELDEARASLVNALALSPQNSQYLSELAHVYEKQKAWNEAMQHYVQAEEAAPFSIEEMRNRDLSRALRGQGYVHIELDQFDEAEKLYQRCLELDANDRVAKNELEYIRKMREQRANQGTRQ